ncbi:two-component sensor histidine kinase [Micromonospora craterilacus]|uniref:histidine kinase n=1 Tax=Micromonospora craterilacus TaxID=1655439 RepID=A0A2W2DY54_9ACTN|nr:HAMP domain-containing sensor histidine kinase [Micromonospora craterilacus]PZG16672.1 two-component sensor histidine kinase [Micromonospora craterilacus]
MSRLPRLRRWPHWSLRARLVLVVAALATLALVGANIAGLLLLRSYLLDRVDGQLVNQSRPLVAGPRPDFGPATATPDRPSPGLAAPVPVPGGAAGRSARLGLDQMFVFYHADGTRDVERSVIPAEGAPDPGSAAELSEHARTGRPYTVVDGQGTAWRLLAVPVGDTGAIGVLGTSLAEMTRTANRLLLIDVAVTGTVLVVLGLLAASVVRLGLSPLTRMERVVATITAGDPGRRIGETDPHTEPGRLGAAVNLMLDRIGAEMAARASSERRLRQFVADASHELRTPLTSIRGFAELYRRGGAPPGPLLDETMSRIEGEATRMSLLVEDLLLLARLDRQRVPTLRPVDLLEIAADTIRDAHARLPRRAVRLSTLGEGDQTFETPTVLGDEGQLRQVAANLVANALQYAGPDARVTVRVGRLTTASAGRVFRSGPPPADPAGGLAVLEVHDDGPGIPAEHAGRVFERLYRADPSRGRTNGGGSGLGLSIASSIVHAHGGCVELDTAAGRGSTFRVLLPAVPREPSDSPADPAIPSQL